MDVFGKDTSPCIKYVQYIYIIYCSRPIILSDQSHLNYRSFMLTPLCIHLFRTTTMTQKLLELAKLEFNIFHSLQQKELKQLSR